MTSIPIQAAGTLCIIRVPPPLDISAGDYALPKKVNFVPRKAQRRPAKNKARSRRPVAAQAQTAVAEPEAGFAPAPAAAPARPVPSAPVTPSPRSRTATRKAPTISVDYSYLRRDLTSLAVLAPAMIVLVLVAFIFLH
jgi:hypothetical protein